MVEKGKTGEHESNFKYKCPVCETLYDLDWCEKCQAFTYKVVEVNGEWVNVVEPHELKLDLFINLSEDTEFKSGGDDFDDEFPGDGISFDSPSAN